MAKYAGKGDSPEQIAKLGDLLDVACPFSVWQTPFVVQRPERVPEAK
jgi:hypothetical protein